MQVKLVTPDNLAGYNQRAHLDSQRGFSQSLVNIRFLPLMPLRRNISSEEEEIVPTFRADIPERQHRCKFIVGFICSIFQKNYAQRADF